jgi:hypothetical protein
MTLDTIQEYTVGEFRGNFPDVPIAAGVDLEALKETDAAPFFVTLPVVPQVGATSKNGLLYDDSLVNSIEEQINAKRPGGIFGHLRDDQRDTAFPLPAGLWVGAKRTGQTLWAKAYIPPGAARDHLRTLKAIGGQIATSIYGKGSYETVKDGVKRLKNFTLESLDFAPPERAALAYAAIPVITAEMQNQEHKTMNTFTSVKDVPQNLRDQIIQEFQQSNGKRDDVAELSQQVSDRDTLIATQQAQIAEFQRAQFDATLDAKIAELVNWNVKGESAQSKVDAFKRTVRSRILSEMGEQKADRIATAAATVWADLQPIAETVRDALSGPPAIVPANGRALPKFEDTPEARAKAHADLGW